MRVAVAACLAGLGHPDRVTAVCLPPPPLCEAAARADMVFLGEVLAETTYVEQADGGLLPQGLQAVRFDVTRAFKAAEAGDWWALFYFGVEAKPFRPGVRYVVFAHRRPTGAFVTGCTLTREIEASDEDVWLRTAAKELAACGKAQP